MGKLLAHEDLTREWAYFHACWHDSQAGWKDAVASDFQQRFITPIETNMPQFLRSLETLEEELKRAERELRP